MRRGRLRRWLCLAFVVKVFLSVAVYLLASRSSLVAQVFDLVGVPSTVYMSDVSCGLCNSFDAGFLIEPPGVVGTGDVGQVFLLNLVVSRVDNTERRAAIRRTWGSVTIHRGSPVRTYFVLGKRSSANQPDDGDHTLQNEVSEFGDIVQVDLPDDYLYLTNKTMSALRWATTRFPKARFLLKSDDDSFNAIPRFVDLLLKVEPIDFVGGMCSSGEQPHRDPRSKWYTPESVYPGAVFPLHAKGRAYVLSTAAAAKVLAVSPGVRFSAMEDLFVTGFCRAVVGLRCSNLPEIPNRNEEISDCDVARFVANVHHVDEDGMLRLWRLYLNQTARELCSVGRKHSRYIFQGRSVGTASSGT